MKYDISIRLAQAEQVRFLTAGRRWKKLLYAILMANP